MGTEASKPAGVGKGASPQQQQQAAAEPAVCPLGFDKKNKSEEDARTSSSAAASTPSANKNTASNNETGTTAATAASPAAAAAAATAVASADSLGGAAAGGASSCPVKKENQAQVAKYLHPHKYNVYSQRVDGGGEAAAAGGGATGGLDPSNNMPANPNQQLAPGQENPLSTERVRSTIPKGGEESTWTYPSPQMFWNALSRKGKAEDTVEGDMDGVVSIHNNMNEVTWKKILQWEKIRSRGGAGGGDDGSEPRLLRFLGRPDDVTPKALAKMMVGHPLPFDRHDWVVDRGGDERRYVIDYYHDEGALDGDKLPELHSEETVKSIKVDVRPALDGFRDFSDRLLQMPLARLTGSSDFAPLPFRPSSTMEAREPWGQLRTKQGLPGGSPMKPGDLTGRGEQGQEKSAAAASPTPPPPSATVAAGGAGAGAGEGETMSKREAREVRNLMRMKKKCAKPLKALRAAEEAGDLGKAEVAALKLEYCTARFLCRKEAGAYKEAVTYADAAASIGDAHAHWTENALDSRLSDMRAALSRAMERQAEGRRREGGSGGGGGDGR